MANDRSAVVWHPAVGGQRFRCEGEPGSEGCGAVLSFPRQTKLISCYKCDTVHGREDGLDERGLGDGDPELSQPYEREPPMRFVASGFIDVSGGDHGLFGIDRSALRFTCPLCRKAFEENQLVAHYETHKMLAPKPDARLTEERTGMEVPIWPRSRRKGKRARTGA